MPIESMVFFGAIIFAGLVIVVLGIKIVPQSDVFVVERLGKFHSTLSGGFHIIVPIIDQIRAKMTVREQLVNIQKQSVITKDNVNIAVDGILFCKISNAEDATYNVMDFKDALGNLAMTTLRSEIGGLVLDEVLSNRDVLNSKLQFALSDAANNWGVKVMRVEISEISVPIEIEEAMNMQMKAEREKRAIELRAIAEKEAQIRKAEGVRQTAFLEAEAIERMADAKKYEIEKVADAQRESMKLINEVMRENAQAAEFLLAKDRIKAFDSLANSASKDKIVVPYNVTELIGSLSIVKEMLGKNNG
ncbi:MAG: SPFH/Band 7/PHB domain protein [Sulfurospirillaceae bacterium]|nr:SPFH/Band 7/PHB domain protein [Sulfurospirillaceae bacterium]MDD3462971.1 SPFH/Band 7/PHB domain protein [Sulfurospirillaceae bacterium]